MFSAWGGRELPLSRLLILQYCQGLVHNDTYFFPRGRIHVVDNRRGVYRSDVGLCRTTCVLCIPVVAMSVGISLQRTHTEDWSNVAHPRRINDEGGLED